MPDSAYQYRWMPKLITTGSFDWDNHWKGATIVDDPDVLRKTASSPVVAEWGDIQPVKNASLIHLIALGASEVTGPNRNGDGFKTAFLRMAHPTFKKHGALYRDHINKDFSKRDGDVVKTAFNDVMGRGELLVAADHDKCADWLPKIEKGERVDFSMGFDCKYDVCKICDKKSKTRKDYCDCVKKLGMGKILPDGRRVYVDNPEGIFNDISKVGTGADQIAQHLRKVAGIDCFENVMSGSELADLAGIKTAIHAAKRALVEKMSRMEKQIPVSSFKSEQTRRVSEKCAAALRDTDPADIFGELVKLAVVLDLESFTRLMMGDRYSQMEAIVKEASVHERWTFSEIEKNHRTEVVCGNDTYEPNTKVGRVLSDWDRVELLQDFSIEPGFARERLLKQAVSGRQNTLAETATLSESARHLLEEYAAYKIATMAALEIPETSEVPDEYCQFAIMSA